MAETNVLSLEPEATSQRRGEQALARRRRRRRQVRGPDPGVDAPRFARVLAAPAASAVTADMSGPTTRKFLGGLCPASRSGGSLHMAP